MSEKIKIDQNGFGFCFWVTGWLFTIGFESLGFWQGVLALFGWPWFLGVRLAQMFPI